MGIKSDVTPQIARFITSNYSSSELPIRLSYAERVIRNKLNIQTDSREVFQLGCESIGTDGIFNDIEIIQLASSLLKKMGFYRTGYNSKFIICSKFYFIEIESIGR